MPITNVSQAKAQLSALIARVSREEVPPISLESPSAAAPDR
jgi:hypothetical protein